MRALTFSTPSHLVSLLLPHRSFRRPNMNSEFSSCALAHTFISRSILTILPFSQPKTFSFSFLRPHRFGIVVRLGWPTRKKVRVPNKNISILLSTHFTVFSNLEKVHKVGAMQSVRTREVGREGSKKNTTTTKTKVLAGIGAFVKKEDTKKETKTCAANNLEINRCGTQRSVDQEKSRMWIVFDGLDFRERYYIRTWLAKSIQRRRDKERKGNHFYDAILLQVYTPLYIYIFIMLSHLG